MISFHGFNLDHLGQLFCVSSSVKLGATKIVSSKFTAAAIFIRKWHFSIVAELG
jgi:hypothetical protein